MSTNPESINLQHPASTKAVPGDAITSKLPRVVRRKVVSKPETKIVFGTKPKKTQLEGNWSTILDAAQKDDSSAGE